MSSPATDPETFPETSTSPAGISIRCGSEDRHPRLVPFLQSMAVVFSRSSPTKTDGNQDAVALIRVSDSEGVAVVADGCGGLPRGDLAAQIAVEAIAESLGDGSGGANLRGRILDGIELAHARIRELGIGSGTTLAIAEFSEGKLRCYHAGDSQILHVGNRGKVKSLTRAHSPTGYAVESGLLSEDDALVHEERYLVSNILGAENYHIEIGTPRVWAPRDTVVVASDGLFDNLAIDEICPVIRKGPLLPAAETLLSKTAERMIATDSGPGKPDDVSLILIRPGHCSEPPSGLPLGSSIR